jgi:hypothetical protein
LVPSSYFKYSLQKLNLRNFGRQPKIPPQISLKLALLKPTILPSVFFTPIQDIVGGVLIEGRHRLHHTGIEQ